MTNVMLNWNAERKCWTVGETETHLVEVAPQLMGDAFICLTPKSCTGVYDERWDYQSLTFALLNVIAWQASGFTGEPEGWVRHLPSYRRREDGDPSTEEIRP